MNGEWWGWHASLVAVGICSHTSDVPHATALVCSTSTQSYDSRAARE
jgi:hypothetical protein